MTNLPALGPLRRHAREGQTIAFDLGGPFLSLTVLTSKIVRVRLAPKGRFAARRSWASVAPNEAFAAAAFDVRSEPDSFVVATDDLEVRIDHATGQVSFADRQGQQFCVDAGGTSWTDQQIRTSKRIEADEHFFGFGERSGSLDKLGRSMVNWTTDPPHGHGPGTDPLYIAIPIAMALRPGLAYGVFFNTSWRSRFDIGREKPGTWIMETAGGELDYYVILGPTPHDVTSGIAELFGTMPLPPRWALGYHQSRWGYKTEADVREVVEEFRKRDLPCDVIHLDIDYMRGYRVFTWDPERFPDPAALLADLRRDGVRVVTIIDPGVKSDPEYAVYQEGLAKDYFVRQVDGEVFHGYVWPDDSVFSDYTRPEVRQWWGDLQKSLIQDGVAGIWNDMNEPTSFELPFSEGGGLPGTLPLDAVQGPTNEQTVHAEVHNVYGLGMAQASYEGLRRHLGDERPFVLTRSAYAGIQRFSACWMGDNHSWWEHLELTMPQLMNMGLSGVPFVGTDIGGFMGNASGELFARWVQLGAFTPFARGHSCADTERHEPWVFGPEVEQISRDYLNLRYRLLPYLYSLFWQASEDGTPVLRPLLYHFPNDPKTYTIHDQVLLGSGLMAAPIYQPGREHRHVYLPEDTWYDWWSEERIAGGTHLLAHAPLERLPLYIRGGSIIPMGPEMHHTEERPLDQLVIHLYPGTGSFTLYEDDGHSYGYERGEWATTTYTLRELGDQMTLEIGARQGQFVPAERRVILQVHGTEGWRLARQDAQFDDDGSERMFLFQRG